MEAINLLQRTVRHGWNGQRIRSSIPVCSASIFLAGGVPSVRRWFAVERAERVTDGMNSAERTLVWILRYVAIFELLAIPTILLPFSWMHAVHESIGLGQLPDAVIVPYLARSVSILYSFHGFVTLYLSTDVRRYLPVIRAFASAAIAMGVCLLVIDVALKLPLWWILLEGPFAIGVGSLVWWLQAKVRTWTGVGMSA